MSAQPTFLKELRLSNMKVHDISGIGPLKNLTNLHLADNFIWGELPEELFNLTHLVKLKISHNELTGTLLAKIGNLANLETLHCYGNYFNGQIPSTIGNLVKLVSLDLAENDFTGTLPSQLNNLINLELLNLHQWTRDHNGIGGPLLDFAGLANLRELYLDSNSLNGTVPASLLSGSNQTSKPIYIGLASNLLGGTVPSELSRFKMLNIDLTDNKINCIQGAHNLTL